jgi:hypothetical protein
MVLTPLKQTGIANHPLSFEGPMLLPRFRLSVSPDYSLQSRAEPLGAISRVVSEGLKKHRARHGDCDPLGSILSFSDLPSAFPGR